MIRLHGRGPKLHEFRWYLRKNILYFIVIGSGYFYLEAVAAKSPTFMPHQVAEAYTMSESELRRRKPEDAGDAGKSESETERLTR